MRKISAVCLPFQPLVKKVIPTDDPEVAFKVPLLMNYVLISRKNECLLHYNLISRKNEFDSHTFFLNLGCRCSIHGWCYASKRRNGTQGSFSC